MQPLYIILTFLSSLSFLPSALSIKCNDTQYQWPVKDSCLCCNKCLPGQRMKARSEDTCQISCVPCLKEQYSDSYNTEMRCEMCRTCKKQHMVLQSACNATHNAVCTCQAGYTCKDEDCTKCTPTPATTKATPTPSATTSTTELLTTWRPYKPVQDTVWFLVIIALLCAGIALVVVTKIKSLLQWIRSKHGYFLAEKPAVLQWAVDEDFSKPVQEVCGKCDQPIDV